VVVISLVLELGEVVESTEEVVVSSLVLELVGVVESTEESV